MVIVNDPYSRLAREHAQEMWTAEESRRKYENRRALGYMLVGAVVGVAVGASACWAIASYLIQ